MVNVETVLDSYRRDAEKKTAIECLKILHSIGGCDATEEWEKGFDAAIDTAFKEICKRFGIDTEEAIDD